MIDHLLKSCVAASLHSIRNFCPRQDFIRFGRSHETPCCFLPDVMKPPVHIWNLAELL